MMLLQLPSFDPAQRVAVVSEPLTVECPRCKGEGTLGGKTWQANDLPWPCPDCSNGRVPFTGRVAIAVPCECTESDTEPLGCHLGCNGLGHLVVASADITAVVPIVEGDDKLARSAPYACLVVFGDQLTLYHESNREGLAWGLDVDNQLAFATFTPGAWAVLLDNVATVEERCVRDWLGGCDLQAGTLDSHFSPIPVAGGDTFRKWEP